jgi:hypothetical protein
MLDEMLLAGQLQEPSKKVNGLHLYVSSLFRICMLLKHIEDSNIGKNDYVTFKTILHDGE